MSDRQIIEALIAKDERVTQQFFFTRCRPLFWSIIHNVFSSEVNYDEFVNEFYLYLMEGDAWRLKQFQGRSTIYQWLKVVAIRYFLARRDNVIDNRPKQPLSDGVLTDETVDLERSLNARMDVEHLLSQILNARYVYVIRRLVLQDADPKTVARELGTNVDNLYNIKKRAISALTEIALKEAGRYERQERK